MASARRTLRDRSRPWLCRCARSSSSRPSLHYVGRPTGQIATTKAAAQLHLMQHIVRGPDPGDGPESQEARALPNQVPKVPHAQRDARQPSGAAARRGWPRRGRFGRPEARPDRGRDRDADQKPATGNGSSSSSMPKPAPAPAPAKPKPAAAPPKPKPEAKPKAPPKPKPAKPPAAKPPASAPSSSSSGGRGKVAAEAARAAEAAAAVVAAAMAVAVLEPALPLLWTSWTILLSRRRPSGSQATARGAIMAVVVEDLQKAKQGSGGGGGSSHKAKQGSGLKPTGKLIIVGAKPRITQTSAFERAFRRSTTRRRTRASSRMSRRRTGPDGRRTMRSRSPSREGLRGLMVARKGRQAGRQE